MGRGSLRILSDNFSPNWRQPQSMCEEREGILNEEDIQQQQQPGINCQDQEMPPVFEDQNMKLILNRNSMGAKLGAQAINDTGAGALWAVQSGCVCDGKNQEGSQRKGKVEEGEVGWENGNKRLGLLDCLSHPQTCLFSCCCPCLAELYVGCAIGKKVLALALFLATLLFFSLLFLTSFFDATLLFEEKGNKLQLRHDHAVMVSLEEQERRRLNCLVTWSYVTYFLFVGLFFVRMALYVVTRSKLRTARLLLSSSTTTYTHNISEENEKWRKRSNGNKMDAESSVGVLAAGSDVNPELCNGAPDLCAVFWCMPCVLCQHVEAVRPQSAPPVSVERGEAPKIRGGAINGVVFSPPFWQNNYEQLYD